MARPDEFTEYLHDLLRPLGVIRLRRMFGGHGIYADELFFALVIDGQLHFKVDAQTRPLFESAGLEEWVYEKEGKPVHMNYFRPPDAIHDDEAELLHWGRLAQDAARRARKPAGPTSSRASSGAASQKATGVPGKGKKPEVPETVRTRHTSSGKPASPSLAPARRKQKTPGKSA